MTSLMTSSWRHSIGFVSTHITSIIPSLVEIGWKMVKLSCSQAQGAKYRKWRHCDVTDDVIITKFNRLLHFPSRINPVKFHEDRIRITQVIVFTRMSTDRRRQTLWLQYPSFCRGVKTCRMFKENGTFYISIDIMKHFMCWLKSRGRNEV